MINSGGMRSSTLGKNITMADLLEVFPFENSIDIMKLNGSTIRQILEKSAGLLSTEEQNTHGGFIQVSGTYHKSSIRSRLCTILDPKFHRLVLEVL